MSIDISRQRFQPNRDFAAVLMKQGGLLLDAEWNEWGEIVDRRLRAGTLDQFGRSEVPLDTPDAFKIALAGGMLAIGPGRMYVDGLLAEQHGGAPLAWDPILAEQRGTAAIPYDQQPYLPDPALLPALPTEGGPHLVYLDVWRRELTSLEDPALVENAVGVDTTGRVQTVWQVRMLPNVGAGTTCASADPDVPGWLDLIQPSAGRLTTGTFQPPAGDDPCLVPPTGGYKGLQNITYRVEVHDGGAPGTATFKWERHNASVASAVRQINGQDLVVDLIGRDLDLRLNPGDWVEITDDARELAGLPGLMRKLTAVTDATRTLTLDDALPAGTFATGIGGATLPERHVRVRRWGQKGIVRDTAGNLFFDLNGGAQGVVPVPPAGTALALENGIQVSFGLDPAGGAFRTGDYWIFAARTADASVEILDAAPPRGIHHHYARLAVVTFPDSVEDCRAPQVPTEEHGCDCSVCVTADAHNQGTLTIQQAVDQVRATGGTVCLGVGTYHLRETVRMDGAQSVRVRGQGWRTVLAYLGQGAAMTAQRALGLTLERFCLLTSRGAPGAADLLVANSIDVLVRESYFVQLGEPVAAHASIGLGGILLRTRLEDNVFYGAAGIVHNADKSQVGATAALLTMDLRCERNDLLCRDYGVRLQGRCFYGGETIVAGNYVLDARFGGVVLTGTTLDAGLPGSRLEIRGNNLEAAGPGIMVGADFARITGNEIAAAPGEKPTGDGIAIVSKPGQGALAGLEIVGNRLRGMRGHGISLGSALKGVEIAHNQIENVAGGGIVMVGGGAESLRIVHNQLRQVLTLAGGLKLDDSLLAGIHVMKTLAADLMDNLLDGVGTTLPLAVRRLAGIQTLSCLRARITGNRVLNVGLPLARFVDANAINALGTYDSLAVCGNTIRRQDPLPDDPEDPSQWRAVRIGFPLANGLGSFSLGDLFVVRSRAVEALLTRNTMFFRALAPEAAEVCGNNFTAYGAAPLVFVQTAGQLRLADNQGAQLQTFKTPVVIAGAALAIVHSNSLQNGRGVHDTVQITVGKGPFTVLGNVVSGVIRVDGALLGNPWAPLNLHSV